MGHKITTTQKIWYRLLYTLVFLAILVPAGQLQGQEINDMFGRKFSIPDRPEKVYSASPPLTSLLYAIDPRMPVGLTVPVREHEKKYLDKRMLSLPVLGGWYGQGNTPNIEMILKVKPDVVVIQKFCSSFNSKTNEKIMKAVPAPVISVSFTTFFDYPEAILYLGRLLGREQRTKALAEYAEKVIIDMKALTAGLPETKKVSVYYAEGLKGLNTDCDKSMHTELINLAGGRNVHRCKNRDMFGMEKISFEQILLYNPDVILVFENAFYRTIFTDSRWQQIKAVRNKRVYLIPNQPFNWFDRPPSFMRLLGAKWVAHCLYPERYSTDIMIREIQVLFKLFLHVDLTAREAEMLLQSR